MAPAVHALFDKGSRQSIGEIGRKLRVACLEGHMDDLAVARGFDLEVFLRNIGGVVSRVLRRSGGCAVQPVPQSGSRLEFRPLREIQLVGGLLNQRVLLQNFGLRLHIDVIRGGVRRSRGIDIAQVEEVLIHSLHFEAGHGPEQARLGQAHKGGGENTRERHSEQSAFPAVQNAQEFYRAAPLAVVAIHFSPIPRRYGRIVPSRCEEFRSWC